MWELITIYIIIEVVIITFAGIGFVYFDKRYRINHGNKVPPGYIATKEVTIDPHTEKIFLVSYNPDTGERFYQEKKD